MPVKRATQAVLRRAGYIALKLPIDGSLARELQRLIADRQIDTVPDIGAHDGGYGALLREIGFCGRIISFEPAPEPFARLRERLDASWQARQIALGAESGTASLHVFDAHEVFNSLHRPTAAGSADWGLTESRTIEVPVHRLDDIAAEEGITPTRTLVKIDTQGHDAAVMRGGAEVLREAAGLQVELPMSELYEDAPTFTQLVDQARALGFALLGTWPVHPHPRPLVPAEFDGLFARAVQ